MNFVRQIRRYLAHYIAAAFALIFVLAIALAHRYMPDQAPDMVEDLVHSLHGPGFVAVAIIVFAALESYRATPANYLIAAIISIGIGFLSEAAQIPGPRDASFSDVIVDTVGVIGGLAIVAIFDRDLKQHVSGRTLSISRTIGLVALAAATMPTIWLSFVIASQYASAPSILTFEHRWESSLFSQARGRKPELVPAPSNWPNAGEHAAVTEEAGRWGVLIRVRPYPDWGDYEKLTFLAASVDGRIHDVSVSVRDIPRDGDRSNHFYTKVTVGPQFDKFEILLADVEKNPGEHKFDLEHVGSIVFSAWEPGEDIVIMIDNIKLEL